ncbi:MAG: hypothetical protein EXX96DRAFT_547069 [Benjaminiella poitrasii]|nr:MAG: hypothetical protein EXX96DRAFT_547069 [Benjaminiella poitrasii]
MESINITPSNSQNVEINDDVNVKVFENVLSDYKSTELNVSATETAPSLQEGIESDDKAREASIAFEVFNNMDELREKAMKLGLKFNTPLTAEKSYKPKFIKLICKHGNAYRKVKGKEEILAIAESVNEEEDSIIKKPYRKTLNRNCPFLLKTTVQGGKEGNPVKVTQFE